MSQASPGTEINKSTHYNQQSKHNNKVDIKVATYLWEEFFSQNMILISVPMKYNLFVSSPRKNDDSQRHDDVISMHSR